MTKYHELDDQQLQQVIDNELDLIKRGRRRVVDCFKRLLRMPVEKLPPNNLDTQIEAILKLGASRNPKALPTLQELTITESHTPHYPKKEAVYSTSYVDNPGDGLEGYVEVYELVEPEVPAHDGPTEYTHPRPKHFLAQAYPATKRFGDTKYEEIDKIVKIAIDTLQYDLKH
jgi:hypothetical protein